jgi:ribonuclease PH
MDINPNSNSNLIRSFNIASTIIVSIIILKGHGTFRNAAATAAATAIATAIATVVAPLFLRKNH